MSRLSPPPSPFDATLLEPLWRRTTLVLFISAGVTLALLAVDLATSTPSRAELATRALSLPLFGALLLAFWRRRRSAPAVIAYVFSVALVDMALACSQILLAAAPGSELFGTLYPLLLLPPLLFTYRPAQSLALELALLVPALATALLASASAAEAAPRVIFLCAVAAFAFVMAYASYGTRRRAYESTEGLLLARDTLEEAQRQLVQAEKLSALGTLSACIAHELSQPLTLLTGYATVLSQRMQKGHASPEEVKSYAKQLEVMLHAAKRMGTIMDHLRGFARRSGRPRRVSVNEVVHGALLFVQGDLLRRGVALQLELAPDDAAPLVVADPIELEQVVLNLLTNARDALRDVAAPRLRIRTGRRGDDVFIEVHDNGSGVPPELRETMFQFFVTSKPEGQGTGLGLWVSNGIVRSLAGSLALVDDGEGGATFRVTLPPAGEGEGAGASHVNEDEEDVEDERAEEEEDGAPSVDRGLQPKKQDRASG